MEEFTTLFPADLPPPVSGFVCASPPPFKELFDAVMFSKRSSPPFSPFPPNTSVRAGFGDDDDQPLMMKVGPFEEVLEGAQASIRAALQDKRPFLLFFLIFASFLVARFSLERCVVQSSSPAGHLRRAGRLPPLDRIS